MEWILGSHKEGEYTLKIVEWQRSYYIAIQSLEFVGGINLKFSGNNETIKQLEWL